MASACGLPDESDGEVNDERLGDHALLAAREPMERTTAEVYVETTGDAAGMSRSRVDVIPREIGRTCIQTVESQS